MQVTLMSDERVPSRTSQPLLSAPSWGWDVRKWLDHQPVHLNNACFKNNEVLLDVFQRRMEHRV